ncbi:O-antigen ligase family protein [Arthrobacter sp. UYCu723]
MLLATGIVVAVMGGLALFQMPLRARLSVIALLAVPQLVVPGLIESASLFQIWVAVCALVMLLRERPRFSSVYVQVLLVMSAVTLVAALWSPLPNFAVIAAVQVLSLVTIALHAAYVLKEDPKGLTTTFRWLSVGVLVESILVIAFRLLPSLEEAFLKSPAAELLIGSDKMRNFFSGSPDNVFDPLKAGGLWLNANTASMFLGVSACAFVCVYKRYRSKFFLLTAVVSAVAVCFTGSKTGLVLLIAMPALAWVGTHLARPRGRPYILPFLLLAYPAAMLVQALVDAMIPVELASNSSLSLGTRVIIWDVAGALFASSPWLGLGFGGWGENFYAFSGGALGRYFPPHNIVIATWADNGIVGALLLCALIAIVVTGHFKRMGSTPSPVSAAWGWSLAAFLWTWIHGMADAVTFYGDIRTVIFLGLLMGFMLHEPNAGGSDDVQNKIARVPHPVQVYGTNRSV